MNIINGRAASKEEALQFLDGLRDTVPATLRSGGIGPETVIAAASSLSEELDGPETQALLEGAGLGRVQAEALVSETRAFLSRGFLETKMRRELGDAPFSWRLVERGVHEKFQPLGVLTHIAAGNAAGLPAFSVLEGLLAGNVNLLKLPGNDDGLSTAFLLKLVGHEPRLAPYVHVFDLPSADTASIGKLLAVSDAVAVWGSGLAVSGIRALAPPEVQLIEWGHRLSFAYVTKAGETPAALSGIARDVCVTEQLLCSSPQVVYYETDSFGELCAFAGRFAAALEVVSGVITARKMEGGIRAGITSALLLAEIEELVMDKKVFRGNGWSVTAGMDPDLKPSPMYRNVWVKPLMKDAIFDTLRPHKGILQTVGLACSPEELDMIGDVLYRCGACRVLPCGTMASSYAGEPHDGASALRRYVRTVVRRTP